jgi:hypothetical protein
MPIFIEKQNGQSGARLVGFKACDDGKCFSKRPMTKEQAMKQRVAIALNLAKKDKTLGALGGKPTKMYFA